VLATLADWTRADAPGKAVGYYGYNTLTGVPPEDRTYARAADGGSPQPAATAARGDRP